MYYAIYMNISNVLIGIISIIIFVFALMQIFTFYNVNVAFFSVYLSYYIFMVICIWMFGFDSQTSEFEGMIKEINLITQKGRTVSTMFNSARGNVEMTTVAT